MLPQILDFFLPAFSKSLDHILPDLDIPGCGLVTEDLPIPKTQMRSWFSLPV